MTKQALLLSYNEALFVTFAAILRACGRNPPIGGRSPPMSAGWAGRRANRGGGSWSAAEGASLFSATAEKRVHRRPGSVTGEMKIKLTCSRGIRRSYAGAGGQGRCDRVTEKGCAIGRCGRRRGKRRAQAVPRFASGHRGREAGSEGIRCDGSHAARKTADSREVSRSHCDPRKRGRILVDGSSWWRMLHLDLRVTNAAGLMPFERRERGWRPQATSNSATRRCEAPHDARTPRERRRRMPS